MKETRERSIFPNRSKKQTRGVLVVVSPFVTPHDSPGGASLPVLYSTTRDGGESRPISANEAHTSGLNNGVDDDGIPDKQKVSFERERERERERREGTNHLSYWATVLE